MIVALRTKISGGLGVSAIAIAISAVALPGAAFAQDTAAEETAADADGAKATTRSALYPVRGPRGEELPLLVYVAPGGETRLRYVFEGQVSGPITVRDGTAEQIFSPGR